MLDCRMYIWPLDSLLRISVNIQRRAYAVSNMPPGFLKWVRTPHRPVGTCLPARDTLLMSARKWTIFGPWVDQRPARHRVVVRVTRTFRFIWLPK